MIYKIVGSDGKQLYNPWDTSKYKGVYEDFIEVNFKGLVGIIKIPCELYRFTNVWNKHILRAFDRHITPNYKDIDLIDRFLVQDDEIVLIMAALSTYFTIFSNKNNFDKLVHHIAHNGYFDNKFIPSIITALTIMGYNQEEDKNTTEEIGKLINKLKEVGIKDANV